MIEDDYSRKFVGNVLIEKVNFIRATIKEASAFRDRIYDSIAMKQYKIIIDLRRCEFIDSTFLGALVMILKRITDKGGSVPVENSVVIVMTKWNKILEVDDKNLTTWVQPGVVTGILQKEVEKIGLFYPPDPGSQNVCTIGGNVANNAGGLRGLKYGVTKNYVLGTEMVNRGYGSRP